MDKTETLLEQVKKPEFSALEIVSLAQQTKAAFGSNVALALYEAWIECHADASLLFAILFNYGAVLLEEKNLEKAREVLERSVALNPDFSPARINLGRVYEQMGAPALAAAEWTATVDKLSQIDGTNIHNKLTALNQLARVLEFNGKDEETESILRRSLDINPYQREVSQHYLAARQRLCKWPIIDPWENATRDVLLKGISPLSMAVFADDPLFQLAVNAHYNEQDVGLPSLDSPLALDQAHKVPKNAPLRIGYLSSDLRVHAIGYLMAELFECHNRKNIEVFVYYSGIIPDDPMMQRIKASVEHWTTVTHLSDEETARQIANDGIQILVDVNGYTRDGKPKAIAMRPAPVIVNWLGFPGTMASPYHNYIVADEWIIPEASEVYYSEKVLRLPCYQPNDRKRQIDPRTPTREEMGLPDDAFVFCCFNGTQKISRFTFERWLSILLQVPNSVLWLLTGPKSICDRLKDYAQAKGVSPDRIVFAEKMPNAQHLARYPLADLFLDTFPYGAHTTCSDALWMGVPVLTWSGLSFASRVCGSLVRSANLPELVTDSPEAYIELAVKLATSPDLLASYRKKLAASRDTCVLFDTDKLASSLESLYAQMWKDYKSGNLPQPDLRNLDTYLEIGAARDYDAEEIRGQESFANWWTDRLTLHDKFRPIDPDHRFWKKEPSKTKRLSLWRNRS
jgi:predicted O-linked N-acetylglucosamine transferase (SPINDLY family)